MRVSKQVAKRSAGAQCKKGSDMSRKHSALDGFDSSLPMRCWLSLKQLWRALRHWMRGDQGLTPRAREINAALNAAIRRRRTR